MKRIALLLCGAALLTAPAIAQKERPVGIKLATDRGTFMLGSDIILGIAGFRMVKSEYFEISLTPRAAYFIKDNLALGVRLNGSIINSRTVKSK